MRFFVWRHSSFPRRDARLDSTPQSHTQHHVDVSAGRNVFIAVVHGRAPHLEVIAVEGAVAVEVPDRWSSRSRRAEHEHVEGFGLEQQAGSDADVTVVVDVTMPGAITRPPSR